MKSHDNLRERNVVIRLLEGDEEIPGQLLEGFRREANAGTYHMRDVLRDEIKIGAFKGDNMVGFSTGSPFFNGSENILSMHSLYVSPESRMGGIGGRLFYRSIAEAKKQGLEGWDGHKTTWSFKSLFDTEREWLESVGEIGEGKLFPEFEMLELEEGFSAEVRFSPEKTGKRKQSQR